MEQQDTIYNQLQEIIKNNIVERFTLQYNNENNNNDKEKINQILNKYNKKLITNDQLLQNKIDEMFQNVDNSIYSQNWNKLKEHQKEFKINEFVNKSTLNDIKKNELKKILINKLQNKKLNNNLITYDNKITSITKIKGLNINDNDFEFNE